MVQVWSSCTIRRTFALTGLLLFLCNFSFSQKHDSLYLYEKIKNVADKSKLATIIYQSVFVEPRPIEYPVHPESKAAKIVNPYLKYEGSYIRKINIKVYDPFGHSVTDTSTQKVNFLQKIGNNIHITSRRWVILNRLLFKRNDTINPLSISESERLLRQSSFVNDARIFISETSHKDSVDVTVLVLDEWAVTVPAELTDVSANATFNNQNLFGFGHQFQQYVGFTKPNIMNYSGYYNLTNIDHTYISSTLSYQKNNDGTGLSLSFNRPFYSPLAKWAGGVSLGKTWKYYSYADSVGVTQKTPLNNSGYDVWLGKNFKIKSKRSFFNQSTNIIVGERYYTNIYDKRPDFSIDQQRVNLGSSSFIGNIGLSVQQFYKEKFIYRFGANEDVPHGLIVQFIYGGTRKEFGDIKYYAGLEIARARHFKVGYFSSTISYGTFFNKFIKNDITLNYRINYFSDLFHIGKWYFRQFINYKYVFGENKTTEQRITITGDELYGFASGSLNGTTKMVMNLEAVGYAPYNLIGFRFAPVLSVGLAMIGNERNNFVESNLYQSYTLGLMLRNENLLINTFQVSFGVLPFLPGGKNNVFIYDPITSFTLRIRAFLVSKPAFISY